MRIAVSALLGLVSLTGIAFTAAALPSVLTPAKNGAAAYYDEIAQGCGHGYHWVGRHRNRYGAWVPGHCARN